ncbi:MAG: aminotransferase class V-fold PLP-dependent enzyme [bacterium]|nr:aminotransferase class V-fold PLP-dependent enzyme [bacterium]
MDRVYFDANAGSRLRKAARHEVQSWLEGQSRLTVATPANPSSIHAGGREARRLVAEADLRIRNFLSASPKSLRLIYTSGGTEGCNSLVHGFYSGARGHIVTSSFEHPAMKEALTRAVQDGGEITQVAPDSDGTVRVDDVVAAIRTETLLVSVMLANNESGAVNPLLEIARELRKGGYSGAIVSDITQGVGKLEFDLADLFAAGVDAVAFSGHKLGALPGIGVVAFPSGETDNTAEAEYSARCNIFSPYLVGGPQQGRLRAGTENIPGIISLAGAVDEIGGSMGIESLEERRRESLRISGLRENLWRMLQASATCRRLTPSEEKAVPNTLLFQVPGIRADDLVVGFDLLGFSVSTGSACGSGKQELPQTALVYGLDRTEAAEVLRVSLDWDATEEMVNNFASAFAELLRRAGGASLNQHN